MVSKKRPDLTIRAFAAVAQRHLDATLFMVGDGPLRSECQVLVDHLGISQRVHFLGEQTHERVRELMNIADVFVQHSVTAPNGDAEGLPVAILEAMASGMPVVSTLHSGIPEAVESGVTGLLIGEHDVNGMGRAMLTLTDNPDLARGMGAAGRVRAVSCFSTHDTIAQLRAVVMQGEV
jgi:glycosyltransferase involved in cell wall biosynthesis